jgi:hypothetical protein
MITGEVITVAEALKRVGLEDLIGEHESRGFVEWKGAPRPFACGHTAVYGYGPLEGYNTPAEEVSRAQNDRKGSKRIYKALHRVSQATAGGPILFSWGMCAKSSDTSFYRINSSFAVMVVDLEDDKRTALRTGVLC